MCNILCYLSDTGKMLCLSEFFLQFTLFFKFLNHIIKAPGQNSYLVFPFCIKFLVEVARGHLFCSINNLINRFCIPCCKKDSKNNSYAEYQQSRSNPPQVACMMKY